MEDVKRQLRESVILPLTKRKLVEKFKLRTGRAILLHSPPGCGKTHLMKAIANQYNIPFQEVSGSELKNAIAADGNLAITGLWSSVRDMAPAILFISNVDTIALKKNAKEKEGKKALSIFTSMLDNIKPTDNVVVVATSENPDALEPSLFVRGRFDTQISIPPPGFEARKKIFLLNLKDVPKLGKIDATALARATEGYSGEDIYAIVEEAKLLALSKDDLFAKIPKGKRKALGVNMNDLRNAMDKVNPSVLEWEMRKDEAAKEELPPPPPPIPQTKPMPLPPPPPSEIGTLERPHYGSPQPSPQPYDMPTAEDIAMMTITQLENECKRFGLKPYGKKNKLQERLEKYIKENNGGV
jgi:transitional endoplasmic reticulum ATPase